MERISQKLKRKGTDPTFLGFYIRRVQLVNTLRLFFLRSSETPNIHMLITRSEIFVSSIRKRAWKNWGAFEQRAVNLLWLLLCMSLFKTIRCFHASHTQVWKARRRVFALSSPRAGGAAHSHRMRVPHSCPHSAHEKCNYFQFRSDHAECITAVTCHHFAMHISASLMCPIFASLRRQRLVRNDEMGKITGDSRVAHSAAAPAN
jgi:hypothetical protein